MKSIIKVDEMSCNHCKMVVEKAVAQIEGVESYDVNLEDGMVEVIGTANIDDIVSAIHKVGYRARRVQAKIKRGKMRIFDIEFQKQPIMRMVVYCLMPAVIGAVFPFGWVTVAILALSTVSCVITE